MQQQYVYMKVSNDILDIMIQKYNTRQRYLHNHRKFKNNDDDSDINENSIRIGYIKDDMKYVVIRVHSNIAYRFIDLYNARERDRYNKAQVYRGNREDLPIFRPLKVVTINNFVYNNEEIVIEKQHVSNYEPVLNNIKQFIPTQDQQQLNFNNNFVPAKIELNNQQIVQ